MRIPDDKKKLILPVLAVGILVGIVLGGIGWTCREAWWPLALEGWGWLWAHLQNTHPAVFFSAFVILLAVGCPITMFYLVAPGLYGIWVSFAYTSVALILNFALTFWIARSLFRPLLEAIVKRAGFEIPRLRDREYTQITIAMRVTPGIPFIMQNYILALAGVPFRTYMVISWVANLGWALALLSLGESIFQGEAGFGLFGVLLIIGLAIITKVVRDRYVSKRDPVGNT
jgi:uncharacterized membrane protein YdjX (TVP38/TMEM64 family)